MKESMLGDMNGRAAPARRGGVRAEFISITMVKLSNPLPQMRYSSKTFLPPVSEKIFSNGSKPEISTQISRTFKAAIHINCR